MPLRIEDGKLSSIKNRVAKIGDPGPIFPRSEFPFIVIDHIGGVLAQRHLRRLQVLQRLARLQPKERPVFLPRKFGHGLYRWKRPRHRNETITSRTDKKTRIGAIPPAPIVNEFIEVIQDSRRFLLRFICKPILV